MSAIPDRMVGCTSCSGIFRWIDDALTVKDHGYGGRQHAPECPGSGTVGLDLGPRDEYGIFGNNVRYMGRPGGPMTEMLCPRCKARPDGCGTACNSRRTATGCT
jgi:hypothetical protein